MWLPCAFHRDRRETRDASISHTSPRSQDLTTPHIRYNIYNAGLYCLWISFHYNYFINMCFYKLKEELASSCVERHQRKLRFRYLESGQILRQWDGIFFLIPAFRKYWKGIRNKTSTIYKPPRKRSCSSPWLTSYIRMFACMRAGQTYSLSPHAEPCC